MNWSVQSENTEKQTSKKIGVNYWIDESYSKRFKQLCQKRGWIMSAIIQNNIKRLVDSV